MVTWKYFTDVFLFLRYVRKDKYRSNLTTSSDFPFYRQKNDYLTVDWTFPVALMSVFRTKRYMQYLRNLFWFLITILIIFNLTVFPFISAGFQLKIALLSDQNQNNWCPLISASSRKYSFYIRNLTIINWSNANDLQLWTI